MFEPRIASLLCGSGFNQSVGASVSSYILTSHIIALKYIYLSTRMHKPETRHTFGRQLKSNCRSVIVESSVYYLHYRLLFNDIRSSGLHSVTVTQKANEILIHSLDICRQQRLTRLSLGGILSCFLIHRQEGRRRVALYRSSLSNATN